MSNELILKLIAGNIPLSMGEAKRVLRFFALHGTLPEWPNEIFLGVIDTIMHSCPLSCGCKSHVGVAMRKKHKEFFLFRS